MSKKLVLYFSVYGTAKKVAEEIARQTGADLTEIIPETPYDSNRDNYNALAAYAKKEHDEDMRPEIKNDINIADYDTVFIGYPMWWYTFPMLFTRCLTSTISAARRSFRSTRTWVLTTAVLMTPFGSLNRMRLLS